MSDEIELISDGDGLAVIGDRAAVERFLGSAGVPSRDLGLAHVKSALSASAGVAQAGSEVAANASQWVKLTKESARAMKLDDMMKGATPGSVRAIVMKNGKTSKILEIVKSSPGQLLSNPAVLAGAAGIMAQLAMQQSMDEIADYLAVIDKKVDDILRAQRDAVLANMIGVDLVLGEAMTVREHTGRVSEVTWSKVQANAATLASTQAYALRQLDALAGKLENESKLGGVAELSKQAEATVQEWLAVVAHCFKLQDATAVLELDRVLDASPDELDKHRIGLRAAREQRLDLIARNTAQLLDRIAAASGIANAQVLLHPSVAPGVVRANNKVAGQIVDFRGSLGLEDGQRALEARRWLEAAGDTKDKVLGTSADGVEAAKRLGTGALSRARRMTGKVAGGIADRAMRGLDEPK
ncbi:hypothetical protein GCM10023221_27320 [Luteimicrobium xylanilyticum]|uniref:Uncharacterized protein n=2 Tax=Luteimicrobium xylanilyticum TaxID=1133546 RepID=A0A5P9QAR1_9MICO|nr:hypothetical protein KDY119_02033 [Luteimicrobium xylanilyticum]